MPAEKLDVNLIPQEESRKRNWEKFLRWVLNSGRYIIIGTEIIVLLAFFLRFKLDRDLKAVSNDVKNRQTIVESFGDLEEKTRFLQAELATISNLEKQSPPSTQVLNALALLTPPDVIFSQLNVSFPSVGLSATALSLGGFSSFLENLKHSKEFENISVVKVAEGRLGIEFTLKLSYRGS
ncbi:MAG: PilN domain-containing protein [bacterium]|nr:PilN domain-containing protein [bacterium]